MCPPRAVELGVGAGFRLAADRNPAESARKLGARGLFSFDTINIMKSVLTKSWKSNASRKQEDTSIKQIRIMVRAIKD